MLSGSHGTLFTALISLCLQVLLLLAVSGSGHGGQMVQGGIIQIHLGSASKRPDVSQQAGEARASVPPPSYLLQ